MGGLFGIFGDAGGASARGGCELAPKEAPPGKKLATFAGESCSRQEQAIMHDPFRFITTAMLLCFPGGCFWGVELAYQRVPGVESTSVGYTQGKTPNPTYDMVRF